MNPAGLLGVLAISPLEYRVTFVIPLIQKIGVIVAELEWDDNNVQHIAQHEVTPEEVEDVCFGLHISAREGSQRYILSGRTSAGRYINVVIERIGKGLFRPITAFEMSEGYKRGYRRRVGK